MARVKYWDEASQTWKHADKSMGRVPVKGVDYFTEEEKAGMVNEVIEYLVGQPVVGIVDSDNNIILNGTLPVGTYTLKYEGVNGEYSDIVELTITEEDLVAYTNVLPLATDADGAVYNGVGYKDDYRISTSSFEKAQTGVDSTGFIPIKAGDVVRFKSCNLMVSPEQPSYGTMIYIYDSTKTYLQSVSSTNLNLRFTAYEEDGTEYTSITIASTESWAQDDSKWAFIRITTDGLSEDSIITINQEIV